jgi:hypothetical protein
MAGDTHSAWISIRESEIGRSRKTEEASKSACRQEHYMNTLNFPKSIKTYGSRELFGFPQGLIPPLTFDPSTFRDDLRIVVDISLQAIDHL